MYYYIYIYLVNVFFFLAHLLYFCTHIFDPQKKLNHFIHVKRLDDNKLPTNCNKNADHINERNEQ